MLFTAVLLIVRNRRILTAWTTRQDDNARRAARGLPPKPANAAARPSPASPPGRPDPRTAMTQTALAASTTPQPGVSTPENSTNPAPSPARAAEDASTAHLGHQAARMSEPNVKIGLTET
jgi:hypothetical protein